MLRALFLGVAAIGLSASASAMTYNWSAGAPDPGPLASQGWVLDYDSPLPAAVTASGSYQIVSGTLPSVYAAPAHDSSAYFSVPDGSSSGSATLWVADWLPKAAKSFSFYWGSVDSYNDLDLLDLDGNVFATIAGASLPPANGDQSAPTSNVRLFVTLDSGESLGGLTFRSTQYAFEHDDLAFGVVPEPATWAMLIAGFGLMGVALRRRSRAVSC